MSHLNNIVGILSGLFTIATGWESFIKQFGLTDFLNSSPKFVIIMFFVSLILFFLTFIFRKVINNSGDSQIQIFGKKNSQIINKK